MGLLITQDGRVAYKRLVGENGSKSVSGPLQSFDGNNFVVGGSTLFSFQEWEQATVETNTFVAEGSERKREGCMSVPDYTCDVRRAVSVVVRGTTPEGQIRVVEAEGFEARAFQHELDHLDGFLILDRVAASSDVFARKRYATEGQHLK
jgi:hypothetical protein